MGNKGKNSYNNMVKIVICSLINIFEKEVFNSVNCIEKYVY